MKLCRLFARISFFCALALAVNTPVGHAQDVIKGDGGKVRLLVNQAGTQSFAPFVVKKHGLDKKYGFELVMVPSVNTQQQINALQSDGADIGVFGWNDIAKFRKAGVKVTGIAPFFSFANTIMVPVDSKIQNIGDLKGKTLGVTNRNGLDWIVMRAVATKNYKMDLEKEVTVQEAAVPLLRGLFEQGKLDATQMFNDLTPGLVATGKFRVVTRIRGLLGELGLHDQAYLLYSVWDNYAAAKPNNVKAWAAAYREAIDILQTRDEDWFARAHELDIKDDAVIRQLAKDSRPSIFGKFEPTSEADIRKTFQVLLETAGPEVLGVSELPADFMTLKFQ